MKKRILASLLSLVMLFALLPVGAFAADEGANNTDNVTVTVDSTTHSDLWSGVATVDTDTTDTISISVNLDKLNEEAKANAFAEYLTPHSGYFTYNADYAEGATTFDDKLTGGQLTMPITIALTSDQEVTSATCTRMNGSTNMDGDNKTSVSASWSSDNKAVREWPVIAYAELQADSNAAKATYKNTTAPFKANDQGATGTLKNWTYHVEWKLKDNTTVTKDIAIALTITPEQGDSSDHVLTIDNVTDENWPKSSDVSWWTVQKTDLVDGTLTFTTGNFDETNKTATVSVTGKLKYAEWTGFSSNEAEQAGYYLPMQIVYNGTLTDSEKKTVTIKGKSEKTVEVDANDKTIVNAMILDKEASTKTFTVEVDNVTYTVDWSQLTFANEDTTQKYTVSGTVSAGDTGITNLAGIEVKFYKKTENGHENTVVGTATTTDGGAYSLNLPNGTYVAVVAAKSGSYAESTAVVAVNGASVNDANIMLQKEAEPELPALETTAIKAAILADHPNEGETAITDICTDFAMTSLTALSDTEVNKIVLTGADLKKHKNGAKTEGYWVGFAVVAPEAAKKVKTAFGVAEKDIAALGEPETLENEVDTEHHSGYTFYTNVGAVDENGDSTQKRFAAIQFTDEAGNAVTKAYKFEIDTTGVIPHTTVTPEVEIKDGTASTTVDEADLTDMINAAVNDTSAEGTEKTVPTVTIDAKGDNTVSSATAAEVTIPNAAAKALNGAEKITLKVETPVGSVELPASKLPEAGTDPLMVVIAQNTETSVVTNPPAGTTVEAYDIEVRKGDTAESIQAEPTKEIKVTVKTGLTATQDDPLYALYIPNDGKPQIIAKNVPVNGTDATFTVPHLSTYALAKKSTVDLMNVEDGTAEDVVTIKYQVGSEAAKTLTPDTDKKASASVPAGTSSVKITVTSQNNRAITVNNAAYTTAGADVNLTTGANTITVKVGDDVYTITITVASTPVDPDPGEPKFTFTEQSALTGNDAKVFLGGKLTVTGLDANKKYLVTVENKLGLDKNGKFPRVGTIVMSDGNGVIEMGCYRSALIMVLEVSDTNVNDTTKWNAIIADTTNGYNGVAVTK